MKTTISIFALIFCFVTGIAFSQTLPVDSTTKKITYTGSISYSIKKEEAYKKIKSFIVDTKSFAASYDDLTFNKFTASGSVSVYYKKEGGTGNTGFVINKSNEVSSNSTKQEAAGSVSFSLEFIFSSNKVIYKITDFVHKGTGEIGDGGPLENYPLCGAEKIGTIPNWDYYKQQVNDFVLKLIADTNASLGI